MLIGPVFSREVAIAPRRGRTYIARLVYVLLLLILVCTAWLVLTGTQDVGNVGDLARFGAIVFQILAPLQLALAVFFAALLTASAVAQEKDRRTLVLLLMTHLSNCELVLGKLAASLLNVVMLLAAALPIFMLTAVLGGVSFGQIGRTFAVTLASVLFCGSLGSTLALWRERTFQALALTVLVLVLWLGAWQAVASGAAGDAWWGIRTSTWAAGFSPWLALGEATRPYLEADRSLGLVGTTVNLFLLTSMGLALLLNAAAVACVRRWNIAPDRRESGPPDERPESIWGLDIDTQPVARRRASGDGRGEQREEPLPPRPSCLRDVPPPAEQATRQVWDNPVLWREIRTWAYGRKMLLVRLSYLVLFALSAGLLVRLLGQAGLPSISAIAVAVVPLFLLSLVLVNAQAVTSMTSERDNRALDLLLATDLSAREIIFGKLGGTFHNTKEMVFLPLALCVYLWYAGAMDLERTLCLMLSLVVLYGFVAMLGVHAGMHHANSASAIATSLGTVFFLFVGVAVCMRIMVAFSGSFQTQLQPFLAVMIGGGIALYVALGARNPSGAIFLASFACPAVTFYAITSLFLDRVGLATVATVGTYGFATAAMLIPALDEFDVATGRASIGES